jgi:hypothetical protein
LLPDLDQDQPDGLEVTTDQTGAIPRFHLGFNSSVDNVGHGPLIIDARRDSRDEPQMVADQTILGSAGGTRTVRNVGRLEYVYSEDHNHWHYLGFDHYELRRASDYGFVAPDQKTGFCLGDRYTTHPGADQPGKSPDPTYTGYCGRTQTGLLALREGISVGYGDIYYATLEGQFVDVTGVPGGQYYLIHRVNADRKLVETRYSNNAASLLIDLRWPDGRSEAPSVKLLRACRDSDVCPGAAQQPPALGPSAAARYARAALASAYGLTGFKTSCPRALTRRERACAASGNYRGGRYSASIKIAYQRSRRGVIFYRYAVSATRRVHGCPSCTHKLPRRSGRVPLGSAASARSAAVAQPRERLVALDHPLLDGIRFRPVVDEIPRLVRHPLGRLGSGLPAQ